MGQEVVLMVFEEVRMEWGKVLNAAFQIADERQWYLAMAESSEEKWASGKRIRRRSERKMSRSPSSKQKVVWGGGVFAGGERCLRRGVDLEGKRKKCMVSYGDGED